MHMHPPHKHIHIHKWEIIKEKKASVCPIYKLKDQVTPRRDSSSMMVLTPMVPAAGLKAAGSENTHGKILECSEWK